MFTSSSSSTTGQAAPGFVGGEAATAAKLNFGEVGAESSLSAVADAAITAGGGDGAVGVEAAAALAARVFLAGVVAALGGSSATSFKVAICRE